MGFGLAALLLSTVLEDLFLNERLIYLSGVIAGGICGRVAAWHKWRRL